MYKEQADTLIFRENSTICCKGANLEPALAKFQMQTGLLTGPSLMNLQMKDLLIISYLRLSTIMKRNINRILLEKEIKRSKKN